MARPTQRPAAGDRQGLLDLLTVIDSEGWEGPTATALLEYVRTQMVRPPAIDAGLRGTAASRHLRDATRPGTKLRGPMD